MRTLVDPQEFVETYSPPTDVGPDELVSQYELAIETSNRRQTDNKPAGSQAVASELNLPRNRLREWVDGDSVPDAKRGVDRARERGWIGLNYADEPVIPLILLTAALIAAGSLNQNWIPRWTMPTLEEGRLIRSDLQALGVDARTVHVNDAKRATEIEPAEDGSVLGRVLHVLGVPHGAEGDASLPDFLDDAPRFARKEFARRVYDLDHRQLDDDADWWAVMGESLSELLREAVAELVDNVATDPVELTDDGILVTRGVVHTLRRSFEWHPSEMAEACHDIVPRFDETPTKEQFLAEAEFSETPVMNVFGNYNRMLRAAGIEPRQQDSVTKDELREEFRRVVRELGKLPTISEMDEHGRFSHQTYINYWGKWSTAKQEIDVPALDE
ncbi:homing endonuclease associated repeat-containing protein [Halostella salina]|uniref:homing endonuclease associated repeat-containing protein n=1 Tax=Halostella salina TaxID=1547897 RepID=UPI000EF76F71|nr:hypothetical protein [Halostella salina]